MGKCILHHSYQTAPARQIIILFSKKFISNKFTSQTHTLHPISLTSIKQWQTLSERVRYKGMGTRHGNNMEIQLQMYVYNMYTKLLDFVLCTVTNIGNYKNFNPHYVQRIFSTFKKCSINKITT